jgi:hypothetical protein
MQEKIDWEEFSKNATELIRQGKPITGKGGIFSPLVNCFSRLFFPFRPF